MYEGNFRNRYFGRVFTINTFFPLFLFSEKVNAFKLAYYFSYNMLVNVYNIPVVEFPFCMVAILNK